MGKENKQRKMLAKAAKTINEPSKPSVEPGPVSQDIDDIEPVKLTKQQKRDLKRKLQSSNDNIPKLSTLITKPKELKENTSVYRRTATFPPEFDSYKGPNDRFVRPSDKQFEEILRTSYDGFVLGKPETFKTHFHDNFRSSLEQLEKDNFYQFDLTQPTGLGTKVAKTYVSRCLVGDPGITYKYLGIRMFAHPWTAGEVGATQATIDVGKRNQDLITQTLKLLKASGREDVGSCMFNLTLINRCYPEGEKVKLKEEPFFKKEKCTVSWHADSSLDHYSSIAVYHCTRDKQPTIAADEEKSDVKQPVEQDESGAAVTGSEIKSESGSSNNKKVKKDKKDKKEKKVLDPNALWEVSLRLHFNAEGPNAGKPVKPFGEVSENSSKITPAVAVPLPDQYSYYLLDDFNHHHHHSVLAGASDRYASTHRVSRVEGHTFDYIKDKCRAAIQQRLDMEIKALRSEQLALSEVEFEWIRQFYIQGPLHFALHPWWHAPMQVLMDLWQKLELRTQIVIQALKDAAVGVPEYVAPAEGAEAAVGCSRKQLMKRTNYAKCVNSIAVYTEMIDFLVERQTKRDGWAERVLDPIYASQPLDCQPMPVPFPELSYAQQFWEDVPVSAPKEAAPKPASGRDMHHKKKLKAEEAATAALLAAAGVAAAPNSVLRDLNEVVNQVEKWRAMYAETHGADSTAMEEEEQ